MTNDPQSVSRLAQATEVSRFVLLVLSLYFVATYAIGATARIGFPYELEWLDGSVVDHVARVLNGKPIFVEPSVSFVPYLTPPLYYWVAAAFSTVLGIGFLPLRIVSFLAALGCMLVLYLFVERETSNKFAGFVTAAFFAATFQISGEWLDMARGDSLLLFFLLLGALQLRSARSAPDHILASLPFVAAFFTGQIAWVVVLALCAHCLLSIRGWLRFLFPATAFGLIVTGTALADWWSGGWFTYYVFEAPLARFGLGTGDAPAAFAERVTGFFGGDLLGALPILSFLAIVYGVSIARGRRSRDISFFFSFAAGMLGASFVQRLQPGENLQVLMPAHALLCLYAGLSLHFLPLLPVIDGPSAPKTRTRIVTVVTQLACVGQLAVLIYAPGAVMPEAIDRAEGERLVKLMEQVEGEIFSPAHGQLPRLAGKAPSAHIEAIQGVIRAGGPVADGLARDIDEALQEQRFAMIFALLTGFEDPQRSHYVPSRRGSAKMGVRYPRGPSIAHSRDVYLPRPR